MRTIARKLKTMALVAVVMVLASACTPNSKPNSNSQTEPEATSSTDQTVSGEGTSIILDMDGVSVSAMLNDTQTAQEFKALLPYEVTVSRASDDLCGTVSEELGADQNEGKHGWEVGEIAWFGGWFTILVDNEENFADMDGVMVIGKVADEYLEVLQDLRGSFDITVTLAE